VAITAPTEGEVFGGGASVRLRATVLSFDGMAVDLPSIPASATPGVTSPANLTRVMSGVFEGDFQLPSGAGAVTLEAGWPATKALRGVTVVTCSARCADFEECAPDVGGGTCRPLGLSLSFAAPNGETVAPNSGVTLRVTVARLDGGAFTTPIPFTMSGGAAASGTLTGSAGSFLAQVDAGAANGSRTLTAGWTDGGPVATANFTVDALPPRLSVVVGGDGGVFQRDELVLAVVRGDETLVDAGLTLNGVGMSSVPLTSCMSVGSFADGRRCFQLDLSAPPFPMFEGGMALGIGGVDAYGNAAVFADAGIVPVTRLRWARTVAAGASVQALVVGSDGIVYAGTTLGVNGNLVKVTPAGELDASVPLGDVQSLAVDSRGGVDVVYAAFNTNRGNIGAVEAGTLAVGALSPSCAGAAGSRTYSGLALYRPGAETFAIGSVNSVAGVSGRGCLYLPTSGSAVPFGANADLDAALVPAAAPTATNVVVSGTTASFLRHTSSGAAFVPVTLNGVMPPTVGSAQGLTTNNAGAPTGQSRALDGNLISTRFGVDQQQVFLRGTTSDGAGNLGSNNDKGVAAVVSNNEAYVGMDSALVRFSPSLLSANSPIETVTGDSIRTSPVLGAPRTSGAGEGYAVSGAGRLLVFSHSGTASTTLWRFPLTVAGESVNTHPAFDCNRRRSNSGTGTLYVGTSLGNVYAVVVDSPRLLDTAGAWPKYQRTMGNAGNTDPAFPVNWSCP
jgi:hypothetical protein